MSTTVLVRTSVVIALLLLWEGVRRLNLVGPLLLASPTEIAAAVHADGGQFVGAFGLTVAEIAAALAISVVLGIGFGAVAGRIAFLGAVSGPLLASLFAVPLITWYPLFMVWFGIGSPSKIAYGCVSGFFPIAINTLTAIRGVEARYLTYGRSIGCSRRELVTRILIPLALPSIVAGLRIGASLAIIGVVVAEMLASLGGIGYLITTARNFYHIGDVYFGILLAVLCALVANLGLSALERRFSRWRELEAAQR